MSGASLRTWLGRLRQRLEASAGRRVVWVTDRRRDVRGEDSAAAALVAVLGREHYQERRKSYPIRGWRDLDRVLRLELEGAPTTLTLIGPVVEDRRVVTFFELDERGLSRAGRALWLVPESLPLSLTLPPQRVATVERDELRYFLSASGASQIAGGAVQNAGLFAMAVGTDADEEPLVIDGEAAAARLPQGLKKLPPAAWLRLFNPTFRADFGIAWRPLAILAAVGLAGYLVVASAYLAITGTLRQNQLEDLGPEVASLLETQREVDRLALEQQALAQVLEGRLPSFLVWRVVGQVWQKGATLEGLSLADGRLTIRGTAPAAIEVLGALAASPGVAAARFGAPVRQDSGREQFVIALTLRDGDAGG